jgi:hypothetical protein
MWGVTEPSPFKCASALTRWPPAVARLQRQLEQVDLELHLTDDLTMRPRLIGRRRVLLAELEQAKVATLRAEAPEL